MTMNLSQEQQTAVNHLLGNRSPVQTLGGYAGTGKTTVITELKRRRPNFAVCAFTGKAANVLRQKGVEASTIHSLIYKPEEISYRDSAGVLRKRVIFELSQDNMLDKGGIIVDEASMVSESIYNDLLSFDVPVIFVGDHGQLEPVEDKFNLMRQPDLTLETIHRNANEIAHFAEFVRNGNRPGDWPQERKRRKNLRRGRRVRFIDWEQFGQSASAVDQIIVGFNKTRVAINRAYREALFDEYDDRPRIGDRVMCLKNRATDGLFNGMQGVVGNLYGGDAMRFDAQGDVFEVTFDPLQFNNERRPEFHG